MRLRSFALTLLLSLALLSPTLLACGPHTPTEEGGGSAHSGQEGDDQGAAPSWASLDAGGAAALTQYAREQVRARLAEVAPELDPGALPSWIAGEAEPPAIGDRAAEQLVNLAVIEAAEGRTAEARGLIALVRVHARNRNLAYAGSTILTELARRAAGEGEEAQRAAIEGTLRELPRARFGSSTVIYQLIRNEGQVRARVERLRQSMLSLESAVAALYYEHILGGVVGHHPLYVAAVEAVQRAHAETPEEEPYAFSTVDLAGPRYASAQPVVVGVWDTGTDTSLFPQRLYSAADGSHGVYADPDPAQAAPLYDPGAARIAEYGPFLRGIMDLRAGLSSSEAAQRVIALMSGVTDAEGLEALSANLDAIGEWAHGTHVAGILLAGLPQGRLAIFRSAWAGETRIYRHRGPTDAELAAERANVEAVADFILQNRVRVVNASLGFSRDYVEAELRHEADRYRDDGEVRARAAQIHAQRSANWAWIFERCPDTLFVVAAGNSNRDVVEYEDVPASLSAPNLMVVGAVDRHGGWATFTNSNAERVRVFDFGVEVESRIPGGEVVPLSGTSMASPNAANLAAKLISLDPSLRPAAVISLMEETATPIAAPFGGRILHEQRAVERVLGRRERHE